VAIIGCGKLGEALLKALLLRNSRPAIVVTAKTAQRRRVLAEKYSGEGVEVAETNVEAVERADLILLSVKPMQVAEVASEIRGAVRGKILVSFVAGVSTSTLSKLFPGAVITRGMTSIAVPYGAPVVVSGNSREALDTVCSLFSNVAPCFSVDEELLNAFTSVLGSGPAFVAYLVEAFSDAALRLGVPRDLALTTIFRVFSSTTLLMEKEGAAPRTIIDAVATPGGTTIEGIFLLDWRGVKGSIMEALSRASRKAKQLGIKVEKMLHIRNTLQAPTMR